MHSKQPVKKDIALKIECNCYPKFISFFCETGDMIHNETSRRKICFPAKWYVCATFEAGSVRDLLPGKLSSHFIQKTISIPSYEAVGGLKYKNLLY